MKPRRIGPFAILLLCVTAGLLAPSVSALQDQEKFLAEIRAAGAREGDAALRRVVAGRRLTVYEHFDELLRSERPEDASIAARVARAYRETFGDDALDRRHRLFAGWSAEQRAEHASALAAKEEGKKHRLEGRFEDAEAIFLECLARFERLDDPKMQGNMMLAVAAVQAERGRSSESLEWLDRAREMAERAGDRAVVAYIENNRAYALMDLGDLDGARSALLVALSVTRESGERRVEAGVTAMLGSIALMLGEREEAKERFSATRKIGEEIDDAEMKHLAWSNLATIYREENDVRAEERALRQALELARAAGGALHVSALLDLTEVERQRGNLSAARESLSAAEEAAAGMDSPQLLARISSLEASFALDARRFDEALGHLGRAEAAIEGAEVHTWLKSIRIRQAVVHFRRGDYEEAFAAAQNSLAAAVASGSPAAEAESRAALSFFYFTFGEFDAAEKEIRAAVDLSKRAGDPSMEGHSLSMLAVVQSRLGEHAAASESFSAALGVLKPETDPVDYAEVLLDLARGEMSRREGDDGKARDCVGRARRLGEQIGDASIVVTADLVSAELALRARDAQGARLVLDRARRSNPAALPPPDRWRFHHVDGMVEEVQGRTEAALAAYRRSVKEVERQRSNLRAAPRRAAMLEERIQPYRALFRLQAKLGRFEDAYATARMAKARTFVERLAPALAGEFADPRPPVPEALIPDEIAPLAGIRAALRPGEALLDYFVDGDAVHAFVVRRDRFSAKRIPLSGVSLAGLVEALRHPGAPDAESAGIERSFETAAGRLGELLLRPVEAEFRDAHSLFIVPNAELHDVTFAALRLGESPLVAHHAVSVLPAADILPAARRRGGREAGSALVVGDPAAGDGFERLPGAGREARRVAGILGGSSVLLLGEQAQERAVRAGAPGAPVIHVAAHARVDPVFPAHSFVALAPGGGEDGRWTAEEIAGSRIRASLVTLSGCDTAVQVGMGDPRAPGDEREGLVRAFLKAGAGSVVANLWEMDDAVAETVLPELYRRARGSGEANALSALQREMILGVLKGPDGRSLSHPFYWAGLVAYGAGERGPGAAGSR